MERLLADLIRMLVAFAFQMTLLALGCVVRLLYWSVRAYGWGRVGGLIGALAIGVWLSVRLWGWAVDERMALTVAGTSAALYGGAAWLPRLVARAWAPGRVAGRPEQPLSFVGPGPGGRALPAPPAGVAPLAASPAAPPAGSIWPELVAQETLHRAWERVVANRGAAGADRVTLEAFGLQAERQLEILHRELEEGSYRPQPPRWVAVPKRSGGMRHLAILAVRDRVVHQALHQVLTPRWDPRFLPCSYAYRPGRSVQQAVTAVERALAHGRVWVVDADVQAFFDRVAHRRLFELVEESAPISTR
jgi:hypothetical protein